MKSEETKSILRNTRGLSTIEYVIILCLIAVVAFAAWEKFGQTIRSKVGGANTTVETLPTAPPADESGGQ